MNIAFYTLGCKLNFSETSFIANSLEKYGYKEVDFKEKADIYVINTCTVTENADKECKYLIRRALKQNAISKIVIIGCYAQLKPKEISNIKGVSLVLGNNEKFNLAYHLSQLNNSLKYNIVVHKHTDLNDFKASFSYGNRTRSFLKIQDGCDYKCSFCTIPKARGKSRSDEIQYIIEKINNLKKKGIKEIVLTGINIGDFRNNKNEKLIDLLHEINQMTNIRVRLSSIEPNLLSEEIIDIFSDSKVLVPHFHIPLQSGSDTILGLMKRRYNTKTYKKVIELINNKINNPCIGVDVIVGFPGESNMEFNKTLSFLKSLNVSYLHVFSYSPREKTEAINFDKQVKIEDKKHRSMVLRNLSEKKKFLFYKKNIGLTKKVLFENKNINGYIYGYSENYIKVKSKYDKRLLNKIYNFEIKNLDLETSTCAIGTLI